MSNNINVKNLSVQKRTFFKLWLEFLKPYHKLRNKEIEILTLFLIKRYELSLKIKDDNLIDKMLFSPEIKKEIRKEMGYANNQVLRNMLTALRKKNAIIDDKINIGLIPNLEENNPNFKLIFNFNINEIGHSAEENSKRADAKV